MADNQQSRTAIEVAVIERDLQWIRTAIEKQDKVLGDIKDLALKTNGRVNAHDDQLKKLEKARESDRNILYRIAGGIAVLNGALTAGIQFILKRM